MAPGECITTGRVLLTPQGLGRHSGCCINILRGDSGISRILRSVDDAAVDLSVDQALRSVSVQCWYVFARSPAP